MTDSMIKLGDVVQLNSNEPGCGDVGPNNARCERVKGHGVEAGLPPDHRGHATDGRVVAWRGREDGGDALAVENPTDIARDSGKLDAFYRALCLVRDIAPQDDGEAMRKAIFDAIQHEAGGLPMSADECAEDPPIECGTFKPLPPQEAALIRLRTERRELQNVRRCTGLSTSQTVRLGEVGAELDRLEAEADAWFKAPRDPGAP